MKIILILPEHQPLALAPFLKAGYLTQELSIEQETQAIITQASDYGPDLILVGVSEYQEKRFELCSALKNHDVLKQLPVIFFTAPSDSIDFRKSLLHIGVDAFLSTQADEVELEALIHSLTKNKRIINTDTNLTNRNISVSENLFQNLVRHIPQKIFIKDLNSVYLSCNENYARNLGITPEEIVGKNDFHFHPEELARKYQQNDREVIDSGETKIIEEPYLLNDQYFWVRTFKVPYRNDAGEIIGVLGIFEDITKQKQLENELRFSNERFAKIFDIGPIAMSINDISNQNRFVDCNEAFIKQTGYSRDEIIGKNAIELNLYSHPEDGQAIRDKIKTEGKVRAIEHHYRKKNGDINIGLLSLETFDMEGKKYAIGANMDISELKQKESELISYKEKLEQLVAERTEALQKEIDRRIETEKILAESEKKYRNLIDYSTSIVLEWDPDVNLLFINKYGLDFFGYKPEEILGQSALGKIVESTESSGFDMEEMMRSLKTNPEKFTNRENENICKDGRKVWIAWTNKGIYDQEGQLVKILSVGIDRTRQHEMEKELKKYHLHLQKMIDQRTEELTSTNLKLLESESKFRAMSENSLTGIYVIENNRIEYANQALFDIFGYQRVDEVIGKNPELFIYPDDRPILYENIRQRMLGRHSSNSYELRGYRKDGEIINLLILGGIVSIGERRMLVGNILEVTENKRNAEKLSKLNRLYAFISQVNQAIVRFKEKEKLFSEICKIAVDFGKFRMAWIGIVDNETQILEPVAIAGNEDGYLSVIPPITVADTPAGRGPSGKAVREDHYFVCSNCETDPQTTLWRDEMIKRGYRSSIALPIKQSGKPIGAFTLYAPVPDFFDEKEIDLLMEVAVDISFALDTIELEKSHELSVSDLARSEQKFHDIFEHMPSGYILFELIYDQNGNPVDHRLIEANAEFDKQTGLNRNEQIGRTSKELPWYWPEDVTQRYYQVAITGKSFAYERYNDSLDRYYDIRVSSPNKGQFALLFNDITSNKQAQEKLLESQTLIKSIVDSTNDMIWTVDSKDFGLLNWNPALENYFLNSRNIKIKIGFRPEELFPEGSTFIDQWKQFYRNALTLGTFTTEYYTYSNKQTLLLTLNCLKEGDTTFGISIFAKDLSEIRAIEAEAVRNQKHFQTIFEEAPLGTALIDSETGKILEANVKFSQITGRSKEELMSIDWMSITHPDDLQIGLNQMAQLKAGEISGFKYKKRYIKPDGAVVWVSITIAAIQSSGNQTLRHLTMIEDITELKAKEESLLILSRAVEQSKVSIVITDPSGAIKYVNPKFCQVTGYSREEAIGQNPRILKAGINEHEREYYKELWDTITSGNDWQGEFINRRKNGEIYYELASISPVKDEEGRISHFVAIKEDITERKKATEQIKTLSAVVEQSPLLILITDASHRITYANSQFTAFTQFSSEEIKGKIPWIFNPKHWEKETYSRMWDVLELGKVWQVDSTNRKKDGTPFWEHVTVFPLLDEKGTVKNYIIIKEDITEKKQLLDDLIAAKEKAEKSEQKLKIAQIELIRSENLLKDVQKISKTGGWEYDLITQQMFWTPELFRIHEIETDSAIDHVKTSVNCYLPEDRGKILDAFNLCVEKGIGYDLEFPFTTYKGNKKWIRTKTEPIFEDGKIIKVIGSLIDITDQKAAQNELIIAKQKAEESDRLKTSFLANMSHEIRTPLNSIIGFSDLLLDPFFEHEQQIEFVNAIKQNGDNLLMIISDILDISQIESGQISIGKENFPAEIILYEINKEQMFNCRQKGLELKVVKHVSEVRILGDRGKIKQILTNLVSNAIKFTEFGCIEIGFQLIPDAIQFFVKDTGIGIKPEYHEKIFERFRQVELSYTRKYGGNGLGLAIARQLAERMGGKITLESEPGKGSTFYLSIPLE